MRLRLSLAGLLIVWTFTGICAAADAPKPPATPPGVKAERDIEYIAGGGAAQSLDLYMPTEQSEKPLPLVVWIHGGGWKAGSKAGCPALFMVPQGYVVASVEYRFSQKAVFPAQIQDCQAAIRWLRANAKKYHIDPDHVGVWGASAGGHLVALLGTAGGAKAFPPIGGNEEQSDRVQAVCDWFGPADFTTVMDQAKADKTPSVIKFNTPADPYSGLIGVELGADKAKAEAVSPVHFVSKDDPPILIMHGDADALVPYAQSVELAEALKKEGVSVVLQKMPGSGHGGPAFSTPKARELINHFFDKQLKGKDIKVEPLPEDEVSVGKPGAASKAK